MMAKSVYVETSVVSYLAARPSRDISVIYQQQMTQDWWNTHRHRYLLVISEYVLDEASLGDPGAAERRLKYLDGLDIVTTDDDILNIGQALVANHAVPEKAITDALHIAIAAKNNIDFLLTWNCKHINNPHTRNQIQIVCREMGYEAPVICTPQELLEA